MKLIQISADWCGPCKAWKARLEQYPDLPWSIIDVGPRTGDQWQSVSKDIYNDFKIKFSSIPTFLIQDDEGHTRKISTIELEQFLKEKRWQKP